MRMTNMNGLASRVLLIITGALIAIYFVYFRSKEKPVGRTSSQLAENFSEARKSDSEVSRSQEPSENEKAPKVNGAMDRPTEAQPEKNSPETTEDAETEDEPMAEPERDKPSEFITAALAKEQIKMLEELGIPSISETFETAQIVGRPGPDVRLLTGIYIGDYYFRANANSQNFERHYMWFQIRASRRQRPMRIRSKVRLAKDAALKDIYYSSDKNAQQTLRTTGENPSGKIEFLLQMAPDGYFQILLDGGLKNEEPIYVNYYKNDKLEGMARLERIRDR